MDKTQEYRHARLAIQMGMVREGKKPAEIRKALAAFDHKAALRMSCESTNEVES